MNRQPGGWTGSVGRCVGEWWAEVLADYPHKLAALKTVKGTEKEGETEEMSKSESGHQIFLKADRCSVSASADTVKRLLPRLSPAAARDGSVSLLLPAPPLPPLLFPTILAECGCSYVPDETVRPQEPRKQKCATCYLWGQCV